MFCPSCRAEYQPEINVCPDCEVELVEEAPPPEPPSDVALVRVFETADVALLPVIKSVLQAAEIPFITQGDEALGVLPVGRVGAGGISAGGHGLVATILVARERRDEARDLLDQIVDAPFELPDEEAREED
jgi:hypothetical protein